VDEIGMVPPLLRSITIQYLLVPKATSKSKNAIVSRCKNEGGTYRCAVVTSAGTVDFAMQLPVYGSTREDYRADAAAPAAI
jgi:hypothetical protein